MSSDKPRVLREVTGTGKVSLVMGWSFAPGVGGGEG